MTAERTREMTPHMRLLALAKAAIEAENSPQFKTNPEEAIERHGRACERVWAELAQQIGEAQDVPSIEPPAVRSKKAMKAARAKIVAHIKRAIDEAMGEIEDDEDLFEAAGGGA